MLPVVATGLFSIADNLIDHFFPDKGEQETRKAEFALMMSQGKLKQLEIGMSAIVAEANSQHTLVALARPMFMYIFYTIVIFMVIIFPIIGIFNPEAMELFYSNVERGFKAIPDIMWTTFITGYLGYTAAREFGKHSKNKMQD